MNAETDNSALAIPEAANQLGLDSFSVYMLIQSDLLHPQRERLGELTIPQNEMDRLLKRNAASPQQ
jgi:predicted DNA-binding transcriptional regulator AlpA